MTEFYHLKTGVGADLYILPTKKFKTIIIQVFMHQQLNKELATPTALLPLVLMRGSNKYPTTQEINVNLENLFGAEITSDILKKGEQQIATFALEVVDAQYLPANAAVLKKGLEMLKDIIYNPLLEEGAFKDSYVRQEKEQLKKQIKGIINDKMALAVERCVQEMCNEEDYGVFKYGYLDKVEEITPQSLHAYYQAFSSKAPLNIFVVGDVDPTGIAALVEEIFPPSSESKNVIKPPLINKKVAATRYVEDVLNIKQGKLSLGFRTNIPYGDDTFPLLFYNGILGGFSHSKLFQNVREKAGLAYYAFSRLEKTKGIMLISSGIEIKNYEKALSIILDQVESIEQGKISQYEFENTRIGLLSQARLQEDNPYQLIGNALEGVINNRLMGQEEIIDRLEKVTQEDVVRVAKGIKLDTVYFLKNNGEGSSQHENQQYN
ncbi:MAG TPA: insulinase family protein [Firmicutes bacterium]|nr:insulinase family protein [Bacillota bacterium]